MGLRAAPVQRLARVRGEHGRTEPHARLPMYQILRQFHVPPEIVSQHPALIFIICIMALANMMIPAIAEIMIRLVPVERCAASMAATGVAKQERVADL